MKTESLLVAAAAGDTRAIGRILSAIEDETPAGITLRADLFRRSGNAATLGITGTPGAGKSTLVASLVTEMLDVVARVAVVAVDPTSPYSGGAVLGDRLRMGAHVGDERVFIRSLANRGHLGGVSAATPAILTALDGLGYGDIVVETVGVGQSEVEIASLTDTTIVTVSPGWGDAVQVAKAGFLEIADIFVVNKADRGGADAAAGDLRAMLDIVPTPGWRPPIVVTTATTGTGVDDLWRAVQDHRTYLRDSGEITTRRARAARTMVASALARRVDTTVEGDGALTAAVEAVRDRSSDPWTEAERIIGTR